MQTEKRAGRVMRSVAAVLVIILAIVALFQGFRMRGKEALFRNVAVETENLPEEEAKRRRQGKRSHANRERRSHIRERSMCTTKIWCRSFFLG